MTRSLTPRPIRPRAVAAALALVMAVAACSPSTSASPSPATQAATAPTAEQTPVPGGSTAVSPVAAASPPTQTDTEWGRIWDALPPSFPLPPDAVATETREGAASASLAVSAAAPNTASLMESALTGAGFSIESKEGPSEDGSFTLNAIGPNPGCAAQVRIVPLSGTTNIVVLYGAGCPFE